LCLNLLLAKILADVVVVEVGVNFGGELMSYSFVSEIGVYDVESVVYLILLGVQLLNYAPNLVYRISVKQA